MPEISITEDQHERLDKVRRDVGEAFVDAYGHARLTDAIEYMLDTYTPPEERGEAAAYKRLATAESAKLKQVAEETSSVTSEENDPDELRGKLLAALEPEEVVAKFDAVEGGEDDQGTREADGETTNESEENDVRSESSKHESANEERTKTVTTSPSDNPLEAANQLLDKHDDKWHKTDGDKPYEVVLPDSSTERVRTKDDVRRLLFRKY